MLYGTYRSGSSKRVLLFIFVSVVKKKHLHICHQATSTEVLKVKKFLNRKLLGEFLLSDCKWCKCCVIKYAALST